MRKSVCVYRFGQIEFGAASGQLTVAGRPVEIDRACRAILSLLLDEAPGEVSKDRLLHAGWPNRLVHENSLAKAIVRLRQAMGADGEAIETVHGYGYRVAAPVRVIAPPPPRTSVWRLASWRRRPVALVGGAAVVSAALLGLALMTNEMRADAARSVVNGEAGDALGRVLWVDDNPGNNAEEIKFLEARKVAVYHVATTEDALDLLSMYEYGAVISDMGRGDRPLAGIDLVQAMRAAGDRRPFILYTVHSSEAQRELLADAGGQHVAEKPDELYAAILPLFGAAE